jgi:hypothetical protein
MVAIALPACDSSLSGALRRAGTKVLRGLRELAPGKEPSDKKLVRLYSRIADVMARPALALDTRYWAIAFELMWPKRTVSPVTFAQAVQSQLTPRTPHKRRSLAYRAGRAAVSAFDLAQRDAKVGSPRDPRGEAEAFLRRVAGYSIAEIATVTDPGTGGKDRVRHRVASVVKAKAVPVVAIYSATVQGRKSAELNPSITLGGPGTSKTSVEVTSNGRTQRNKRRQRLPPARRGGPDNPGTGK